MISPFWSLALGILIFLMGATSISWFIAWRVGQDNATVRNLLERVNAWWWLVGLGVPVLAMGEHVAVVLFAFLSFLALREFLSLTPTRPGDRPALFTAFFVAIPLQYFLVATGWYGLFSILVPVYGFFVLSAISTVAQDPTHFLERNAKIQYAVMVCVYGVSHAPALLFLELKHFHDNDVLLLFFLLIAQISDVLQYVFGKLFGRHKVAPVLSPNKTVEGLVGGCLAAAVLGGALHGFTPFTFWQALVLSLAVVISGFFGGLVLSAVKRSLGAKDWGSSIPGHGGMLDRLDSIAFSAPIFFHLTRYFFLET
jgi:phosphatidate cytidylyltransferase